MQNHEASKCSRSAIETFGNEGELRYTSGPFEKNVGCQKYVHNLVPSDPDLGGREFMDKPNY